MSAAQIRCPRCLSDNAWCNGRNKPEHNHTCLSCGYQMWPSDRDRLAAEHAAARPSSGEPQPADGGER